MSSVDEKLMVIQTKFAKETIVRLDHIAKIVDTLRQHPANLDTLKQLRHEFHKIAGSGGTYGFTNMSRLARSGEEGCNLYILQNKPVEKDFLDHLEEVIQGMRSDLADSIGEKPKPTGVPLGRMLFVTNRPSFEFLLKIPEKVKELCDIAENEKQLSEYITTRSYIAIAIDNEAKNAETIKRIKQIRQNERTYKVPVIVIVENLGMIDRIKMLQSGATSFVPQDIAYKDYSTLVNQLQLELAPSRGIVFLLESNESLLQQIKQDLTKEDIRVYAFTTYDQLKRQWMKTAPDLIISNVKNREVNIYQFTNRLKNDKHFSDILVILLCENGSFEQRQAIYTSGADDFILLPYIPEELIGRVRSRIELKRYLKSTERTLTEAKANPRLPKAVLMAQQKRKVEVKKGPVKILVADDDPPILELLKFHFGQQGWFVKVANDGEEAEKALKEDSFHFIILDIHMPFRSGLDVLKEMGKNGSRGEAKVVILSAHSQDTIVQQAFAMGADDFIPKPFNPEVVVTRLKRFMEHQQ